MGCLVTSILLGQQYCHDALGHVWIGWVGRAVREALIVVVDLPHDPNTLYRHRSAIVLLVWIVVLRESIKDNNGVVYAGSSFLIEGRYTRSEHNSAADIIATKVIVERTYAHDFVTRHYVLLLLLLPSRTILKASICKRSGRANQR